VHLRCLEYRAEYLAHFMGSPTLASTVENRLTHETFPNETACLESLFANNQLLLESLYPALGEREGDRSSPNRILSSSEVGVIRLPIPEVTVICQLGDDVSPEKPLQLLLVGRRSDASTGAFLVTLAHAVSPAGRSTLRLGVKELRAEIFGAAPNSEVQDVQCCTLTS
jgi:hypothetical protein